MSPEEDNGTVDLPKGKIVGCSWQVIKKLGEGGCGSVYLVKSLDDDSEAAMKVESNFATGGCVLKLEVAILKRLAGKPHVAQLMCAARVTQYSYMVMTLLGDSLNRIYRKMGRACTVSTQARIGANILFCLKQIHDIGFIHRDLKPANVALGQRDTGEARFFHVLDFGLARQYVVAHSDAPNKLVMRRPRDRALFRGTTRYCSIRMHDRSEQGRVDDLWSMIYMLAELRGPLPWAQQTDKRVVGELKRMHTDEFVLQNSPLELLEIAKHLRTLTYFHRPDYHRIFLLFLTIMEKGKFKWDDPFDWENITRVSSANKQSPKPSRRKPGNRSVGRSREVVNMSRERSRMSREVVGSKESTNMSRESMTPSRESAPMSRENINNTKLSKEVVANGTEDQMRVLPFNPEFFQESPIGF
ncbi:unnamed protein product [Caenorhabditis bovis]|uniref:Protein kinase domain-containing protein n=1 Tax=Caenorhabditis bovis TaxID=2654633 RepID=A0A8S1EUS2_9PELO|nr:unnamed protein product [Caenorhabditis bovis]